MACGGFSLIAHYFDHIRSSRFDVELGIGGDYALLNAPEKQTLAINTSTLVADNHLLHDIDPADLAYKALVVNLGDLVAIGVDPAWLTLALISPDIDEVWLESFSDSLSDLLDHYDMQLIGDDTTCGPLSVTLGVHGFVSTGRALTHSGARPNDWIHVTGIPGDSAAGLATLQSHLQVTDAKNVDYLIKRHLCPLPHILRRQALRDLADLAIDLFDGLTSDLEHIVKAGDCGVRIDLTLLPSSDTLSHHAEPEQALRWALFGDEDYELYLTVPEPNRGVLDVVLGHLGIPFTYVGQMTVDIEGLCSIRDGRPVTFDWKGYDRFATP